MPGFSNVGPALRYLRLHGGREPRKQMEVAAVAAVTRGMLSSYERGKQEPSLGTLERLLEALGADLVKLQWALRMVETEPGQEPVKPPPVWSPVSEIAEAAPVYRAVSVPEPLSPEEEHALGQMIAGFLSYLRFTRGAREYREAAPGPPPAAGDGEG